MEKGGRRPRKNTAKYNKQSKFLSAPKLLIFLFIIICTIGVFWSGFYAPAEYDVTSTIIEDQPTEELIHIDELGYRDNYVVSGTLSSDTNRQTLPFWLVNSDLDGMIVETDNGAYLIEVDEELSVQPAIFITSLSGMFMFIFLYLVVRSGEYY